MVSHEYDSQNYDPSAPVVELVIANVASNGEEATLTTLIDSGADATMVPVDVLKNVGARYITKRYMRGVIGKPIGVDTYLATIRIGSMVIHGVEIVAIREEGEAILGRDVLNELIVVLNGLASVVEISQ